MKSSLHLKNKKRLLEEKNGDDAAEQFSHPQTQLFRMKPNVFLVSTKLDFVTVFTDFCDVKKGVHDSFRFGPRRIFHFFLFCGILLSPIA